jgi:RNA polymerase sigma-70 factor (ECF subfamily)
VPYQETKQVDPVASDADLVTRIADGDPRAEEEMVRRFSRVVRIVLGQLLRDAPEAEDLFQDTFCLALQKIRRREVQNPDRVSSFIASVARNVAINHFRIQTRRRTDQDSETIDRIASVAPAQLHRVMAAERSTLVRRLIGELPAERDRELLLRFYLADDDKTAICRDLGLDSLHFNRVLHRARRRLKELYEQREEHSKAALAVLALGLTMIWAAGWGEIG